jgi:EAL and modified HD-GYP domain-containing signal transduction protein
VLDVAILGQIALGYSPFIDAKRAVTATRLTVFPLRPDAALDAAQLLHAVGGVWPVDGGQVSLNIASESLLQDLMKAQPSPNLMIEVPAFMACDAAHSEAIRALHGHGNTLLIKGRPLTEMPRDVLPCFKYAIVDLTEDRRIGEAGAPPGITRSIPVVQSGVRTIADMEASFKRGSHAVLGWPIDDAIAAAGGGRKATPTDLQALVELVQRIDAEEPIERLELTLKRDPSLAFKLMRYINSPAFGLRVEISSFRHAIMMLGYKRLKRWLALLLATASKDANMKPVMFAAVRRGMLMEELVRGSGDETMRNEMFICGVFSLLDRMFQQPFAELLETIPVPEGVRRALVDGSGPYHPYLELVRAIENESLFDFRESAEQLMMSVSEINRAQLRALTAAGSLD